MATTRRQFLLRAMATGAASLIPFTALQAALGGGAAVLSAAGLRLIGGGLWVQTGSDGKESTHYVDPLLDVPQAVLLDVLDAIEQQYLRMLASMAPNIRELRTQGICYQGPEPRTLGLTGGLIDAYGFISGTNLVIDKELYERMTNPADGSVKLFPTFMASEAALASVTDPVAAEPDTEDDDDDDDFDEEDDFDNDDSDFDDDDAGDDVDDEVDSELLEARQVALERQARRSQSSNPLRTSVCQLMNMRSVQEVQLCVANDVEKVYEGDQHVAYKAGFAAFLCESYTTRRLTFESLRD